MNRDIIGILGGSGFLGKELVSILCKSGFQVRVFSRNATYNKSINLIGDLGQVTTFSGNVNDKAKLEKFMQKCDVVINLVALFFEYGNSLSLDLEITKVQKT